MFGEAAMFTAQIVNANMKVGFNSEDAPQNAIRYFVMDDPNEIPRKNVKAKEIVMKSEYPRIIITKSGYLILHYGLISGHLKFLCCYLTASIPGLSILR